MKRRGLDKISFSDLELVMYTVSVMESMDKKTEKELEEQREDQKYFERVVGAKKN